VSEDGEQSSAAAAACRVPMRDGTRLATDVYLPGRPGRIPTVLARTPYGKRGNPVWYDAIGRLFADSGMAFVAQDTRGQHDSEGTPAPFTPEASDGYDTCEWIVGQPWSDGTLAVFGESYAGYTALAAAASGHPAIRAAALRNTTTDIDGDWLRHQGVLRLEFLTLWAFVAWCANDSAVPTLDWAIRPLSAHLPAIAAGRTSAALDRWAREAHRPAVDASAQGSSLLSKVRVPAHFTAGWWDLFIRGELRDWSQHAATGLESHLRVEATDHAGRDWSEGPTADPLVDLDVLATTVPTLLHNELAFLRRHLLGLGSTSAADAVTWTLTNVGPQTSPTWPPPDVESRRLHLGDAELARRGPEGGSLAPRPDHLAVEARWQHDPRRLVPSLDGEAVGGLFHAPDERLTQVRDDVLTFTSDVAREPWDLAGPISADLRVRAADVGGHIMVKLCDVYPAGDARRIVDGAARLDGGEQQVRVDLGATGYRVRTGHRLRLEVSSSAFPRYIWHPGTTDDPWDATRTQTRPSGLLTGPSGSSLVLTVLRRPIAT
jgi:putative CocE/NonD family hydrolase